MGWYQGLGGRLIVQTDFVPAGVQPAPEVTPGLGTVRCPWAPTLTLSITEDVVPVARVEGAEVVNVVVGLVKSAFTKDGFSFTLGLPLRVSRADVERGRSGAQATASIRVTVPGGAVGMSVAVRSTDTVTVKIEELREGNVLAEDIRTAAGALLVPACTRITDNAARRLRETLRGKTVRICAPPRMAA